jgi:hypothetical protein
MRNDQEIRARELLAEIYEIAGNNPAAFTLRTVGPVGTLLTKQHTAIVKALSPTPSPTGEDVERAILRMLNALHPCVGEPRFLSMSDLSDEQAERARNAVLAVLSCRDEGMTAATYSDILAAMKKAMRSHPFWRKVVGTPAETDLPVRAANIAVAIRSPRKPDAQPQSGSNP